MSKRRLIFSRALIAESRWKYRIYATLAGNAQRKAGVNRLLVK